MRRMRVERDKKNRNLCALTRRIVAAFKLASHVPKPLPRGSTSPRTSDPSKLKNSTVVHPAPETAPLWTLFSIKLSPVL